MPTEADAATARLPSGALEQERFGSLLRAGLNGHALLLSLAIAYVAAFVVLAAVVPAVAAKSGLEVGVGILTFSLPAALFALAAFSFAQLAL